VATVSSSESVRAVLTQAAGAGVEFRVLVPESRPAREGVAFAESLPAWDIPVTLVADAALPGLVDRCQLVLVGADSVSESDFVHKVGTLPLALAAREHDVPVYVAALLDKFIPSGLRGTPGRLHDETEVLPERPAGVAIESRYFEVIPHSLIRGIVTEEGIIDPADVPARLAARPVAPVLLELLFPRKGALRESDVLPEIAGSQD
jgi:translation initiation factor 2B subunit (eIF-2B alpha/beta/delta family)